MFSVLPLQALSSVTRNVRALCPTSSALQASEKQTWQGNQTHGSRVLPTRDHTRRIPGLSHWETGPALLASTSNLQKALGQQWRLLNARVLENDRACMQKYTPLSSNLTPAFPIKKQKTT